MSLLDNAFVSWQTWIWSSVSPFTTSSTGTEDPAHPLLATAGIDILEPRRRAFLMANMLLQHRRVFAGGWYLSKTPGWSVQGKEETLALYSLWLLADSRLYWHPAAPCWSQHAFSSSFSFILGCSHNDGRVHRPLPLQLGSCVEHSLKVVQFCETILIQQMQNKRCAFYGDIRFVMNPVHGSEIK